MNIYVMEELSGGMSEDFGPGDRVEFTKAVHASSYGSRETLCGKSTAGMKRLTYERSGPDAPWLPPSMQQWECLDCAAEVDDM